MISWDAKKLKSKCLAGNLMGLFTEGWKRKAVHLLAFHGESNGDIFRGGTWTDKVEVSTCGG